MVLLSVLLLSALVMPCRAQEKKLAKEFVKQEVQRNVLLLQPSFVYKTSLKTYILDSLGIKDKTLFDSVLMANSVILQYVDDSLFIANYMAGLKKELKRFRFSVYDENRTADFMAANSNAYIVNVAQIELEEDLFPYRDATVYENIEYYHDHLLNSLTVDSWFEISEVNTEKNERQVYFASDAIMDDIHGEFTYDVFSDEIKYFYTIDSLTVKDVYVFAYQLGRTYAAYTFDLIMNKYISDHLPKGKKAKHYLRFDPVHRKIFQADDDRFVPLDK
ncbi:MAG: hypothetical protein GXO86_01080 [Chlorobi bacterium]|nr:hypothetical protein [Chlorobiota bacterium]